MKLRSHSGTRTALVGGTVAGLAVQALTWVLVFRVSDTTDAAVIFLAGMALTVAVTVGAMQVAATFIQYQQFRIQMDAWRIEFDARMAEAREGAAASQAIIGLLEEIRDYLAQGEPAVGKRDDPP